MPYIRILWILQLIFLLFIQKGFSIETPTKYFTKYLGTNEGLPSRNISGITQDEEGIMWIGSRDMGLIRFDGHKFTSRFEDPAIPAINESNEIFDLITDSKGNILIAGSDGLLIFNPRNGKSKKIFQNKKISALFKDHQQNIWFSTNEHIFVSPPGKNLSFQWISSHSTEITMIMEDPQKNIWFTDLDGRCLLFDKRKYRLKKGIFLNRDKPINWFQQIINVNGELLGINYFNVENKRIPVQFDNHHLFKPGFPANGIPVFDIIQTGGFPQREFMKFGKGELKFFKDNLNTIWIGTGYGIILLKEKSVQFKSIKALEGKSVRGILENENGKLIIATYAGLYEWDRKRNQLNPLPATKSNINICFKPIFKKGDTLITTLENYYGYGILDLKKNKFKENNGLILSSSGLGFRGAYYDKENELIYFGNAKVFTVKPENLAFKELPFENKEKDLQLFDFFKRDSNSFLIGTDRGLLLFDLNKGWMPDSFKVNRVLSNTKVRINHILNHKKGQLWLSTHQIGIILYDVERNKILSRFTMNEGLPSNEIYAIYSSDEGNSLWLSTANGISLVNIKNNTVQNFSTNDGLIGNEFNTISHFKSKDGVLFFGGTEGVTYFNPADMITSSTVKPTPFISEIEMYDSKEGKDIHLTPEEGIVLKWFHTPVKIFLGGNNYFDFKNQTFRYRLIGFDNRWQYTKGQVPIQYHKLPQGEYTLEIQSSTNERGWIGPVKKLQIIQKPIWYKQTYVLILLLILLFFILYLIISNKLNQLQKEQNVRLEIAEDLHDRMGSMIFSINYGANKLLANKGNSDDQIKNELTNIIQECRRVNLAISDIIWAIDLGRQKFRDLIVRFQDYSDRYLLEKGIKVAYHISEMIPTEKNLTLTIRHQLMMIFTEAIQNILKHAPDSRVVINMNYERSYLTLEIINSFQTRSSTAFSTGHGMNIMQKRAKRMEATLHFNNDSHQFIMSCKVRV